MDTAVWKLVRVKIMSVKEDNTLRFVVRQSRVRIGDFLDSALDKNRYCLHSSVFNVSILSNQLLFHFFKTKDVVYEYSSSWL